MPISRRQFLRTAAISSLVGFNPSNLLYAAPCNCVSILLHGFFFMEFQDNLLIVAAPHISGHQYLFRGHGTVPPPPHPVSGTVDLSFLNSNMKMRSFRPEILQFSRNDIGQSGNLLDSSALALCSMVLKLPIPDRILPLWQGDVNDLQFDFSPPAKVANSINKALLATKPKKIALVTCLEFENNTPVSWNFYAEHPAELTTSGEVNNAFDEVMTVFKNFDLHLTRIPNKHVPCDNDPLPDELDLSDESALPQLVINPPLLCPADGLSQQAQKQRGQKDSGGIVHSESVQVSTCPQFGVNP